MRLCSYLGGVHITFFIIITFFYCTVLATLVVFHNFVSMCDCHMLINDLLLLLLISRTRRVSH